MIPEIPEWAQKMGMTKEIMGEIAYDLLSVITTDERISMFETSEIKKKVGNASTKLDRSREIMLTFTKIFGHDIFEKTDKELQAMSFSHK